MDIDSEYGRVAARFYDAAYEEKADVGTDAVYYRELAADRGGPVLELGCGTGRVLLPIAQDGLACVGLDGSRAMLEAFREKDPPQNLRLVHGFLQDFDLGEERFALIFSAFRAFQHLYTVEDQLACLRRARQHLTPGGILAFDVFHPKLEFMTQDLSPEQVDLVFEQEGYQVSRFATVRRNRAEQMLDVQFRFECRKNGEVVEEATNNFRMRWFYRFELEHLLARAGFTDVTIYGDFDQSPLGSASPNYVVVAS